jgi:hypothetical protein
MQRTLGEGRPSLIIMTAPSLGKGVTSPLSGTSSTSMPQVRDPEAMKFFIMPQSLSLCLMG